MSARSIVGDALYGLAYHARAALLCDLVGGTRIRLLGYHGIPSAPSAGGIVNRYRYNIAADEFERHAAYLARRCNVVSLDDAIAGRRLARTRMNVVITFDDGYANNHTNAARILARFELPAVFSVPTGFVLDRRPLWNDVLELALARTKREVASIAWDGERRDWPLTDLRGRIALHDWLMRTCTEMDQVGRDDLVAATVRALEVDGLHDELLANEEFSPLSREQLQALAGSELVELASHSVNHCVLTNVTPEQRTHELAESKRALEAATGKPCATFCVPSGKYDDALVREALALGYRRVLTSSGGVATPGRRLMGRTAIFGGTSTARFADCVHGPIGVLRGRAHG